MEQAERHIHHLQEASELLGAIGRADLSRQLANDARQLSEKLEQAHRAKDQAHQHQAKGQMNNQQITSSLKKLYDHVNHLTRKVQELERRLNTKGDKH